MSNEGKADEPEGGAPGDRVVRTPRESRQSLDPSFEHLARGEKRGPREHRPRLRDDRVARQVPGVANRDARAVSEARIEDLKAAIADREEGSTWLARTLAEAVALRVWRGVSIVDFDAFAEQILELDPAEAKTLATEGARAMKIPEHGLSEEAVATWMRTEAALLAADVDGKVRITVTDDGEQLRLQIPVLEAPQALTEIGKLQAALAGDFGDRGSGDRGRRR